MALPIWLGKLLGGGIGQIIEPITGLIDDLHTSKEEKMVLQAKFMELQTAMAVNALEYEKAIIESKKEIIVAEAKGQSWIQRNWRPILMLTIVAIVFNNYVLFPYLSMFTDKAVMLKLPNGLWALMTTGVGGYIVGRSAEKIVPGAVKALKEKKG